MTNKYPIAPLRNLREAKIEEIPSKPNIQEDIWSGVDRNNNRLLLDKCENARKAFLLDGLFNSAIGRYIDSHAGFRLKGDPRTVAYLEKRLVSLSFQSTNHWQDILSSAWTEFCITGNAAILKIRGEVDKAFRPFYENTPYPIQSLYVTSLDKLTPVICQNTKKPVWAFKDSKKTLLNEPLGTLEKSKAYIKDLTLERSHYIAEQRDVLPLVYLRQPGQRYGIGLGFAALEDVKILRQFEQALNIMVRKTMIPITHAKVTPSHYAGDTTAEINKLRSAIQAMGSDNFLLTGPNVELNVKGYESQSLRTDGPLTHSLKRAVSGLSASPVELGLEKGNMGDAEAAANLRHAKMAKAKSEFLRVINEYLIWELLYEGGFNPYERKKDQAFVEFIEVDAQKVRTNINFWVDAYVKGFVGWEEALSHCPEINSDWDRTDTYVYNVDLVKLRAERDEAIEVAKLNLKGRQKSSTTSRLEAEQFLSAVLPLEGVTLETNTQIPYLSDQISSYLGLDLLKTKEILNNFSDFTTRQQALLALLETCD